MKDATADRLPRLVVWGIRFGLALFWLAAFAATHWPPSRLPSTGISNDKLQHFMAYALLGGLLTLGLATWRPWSWRMVLLAIVIASGYGVFDELTQLAVGRTADVRDWIADTAGAIVGSVAGGIVCQLLARWRQPYPAQ